MTGDAFGSCQIGKQPLCRDPVIPSKHASIRCNAQVDAHIRDNIAILTICLLMTTYLWSRDWSRSGGSYGNNTRVICCPAQGCPESVVAQLPTDRAQSRLWHDQKIWYQTYLWQNTFKITPNWATVRTCLHCDVILSWRVRGHEERRQAPKTVWPVNARRVICRYQNNSYGIINHHKHIRDCFSEA